MGSSAQELKQQVAHEGRLEKGKWVVEATFSEENDARMRPFEAIAIPLHRLWV